MGLADKIKSLLTGAKTLARVSLEELRAERLRLEKIEERLTGEIDKLEHEKQELFARGTRESSPRQQVALARKIKEFDVVARAKDRQLAMIAKQVRILSGLTVLKESQELVDELGMSSLVNKMDLADLQRYVDRASIEGQFHMDRFTEMLHALESGEDEMLEPEEADTQAIVAAMQQAQAAEAEPTSIAITNGMTRVNEILKQSRSEPHDTEELA